MSYMSYMSYSVTKGKWFDCGVDIDHLLEVSNELKGLADNGK